jgi:hypothetical protein
MVKHGTACRLSLSLDAARTTSPGTCLGEGGAGRPAIPRERQAPELTAGPTRERPGGLHLHFHGVSAEDVAAIIKRHRHHG